jgi:hypothetical protein
MHFKHNHEWRKSCPQLALGPLVICTKLKSESSAKAAPTQLTLPFVIFISLKSKNNEELKRENEDWTMDEESEVAASNP